MSVMSELDADLNVARTIHISDFIAELAMKQRLAVAILRDRLKNAPIMPTEDYWSDIYGDVERVEQLFLR